MKSQTINPYSFEMKNFKNQKLQKVSAKKEFDEDDEVLENDEDYAIVDEDADFIEPTGPKKEDLKTPIYFIDDDDDDDDDDEF